MKAAHQATALPFPSGGYDAMFLPCTAVCIEPAPLFKLCARPACFAASSNHREPS
jgi:hypothetical protein